MQQEETISEKLVRAGHRLTPQRLMVVSAIESSADHVSAEEIHARVAAKFPNVNISTVYRTLELLKGLGLVTETDLGGGRVRYHPFEKGRHHHLICEECGKVTDLDESVLEPLKDALLHQCHFVANLRHVGIFGRCVKCRK